MDQRRSDYWQRVLRVLRWVFGPAAAVFLVVAAVRSRDVFGEVISQARAGPVILAIVLLGSFHLVAPVLSWLVLRELGNHVGYGKLLQIHVRRLPARYLPGGIWHTVSRVVDVRAQGVSRRHASMMVAVENLVSPAVALSGGGLLFLLARGFSLPSLAATVAGPLVIVAAWLALRHRLLARLGSFSMRAFVHVAAISLCIWVIAASAFTAYWFGLPDASAGASVVEVAGSYLLAWTAGFVNVLAPQGIGTFEATIGALLDVNLSFSSVAVLATGFRAVTVIADFLTYGVFQAVRRRPSPPRSSRGDTVSTA